MPPLRRHVGIGSYERVELSYLPRTCSYPAAAQSVGIISIPYGGIYRLVILVGFTTMSLNIRHDCTLIFSNKCFYISEHKCIPNRQDNGERREREREDAVTPPWSSSTRLFCHWPGGSIFSGRSIIRRAESFVVFPFPVVGLFVSLKLSLPSKISLQKKL